MHIVCWDPAGEYWEGAVVDDTLVGELSKRGSVLLPCIPELFHQVGFCGFSKRSWGAGWPLPGEIPGAVSPIAIFYPGEPYRHVHWAARLVGEKGQGIPLRLIAAESRGNMIRPVMNDVLGRPNAADLGKLPEADEHGGWTVTGEASLSVACPAMVTLALWGCARGMRVAWLAATLTP